MPLLATSCNHRPTRSIIRKDSDQSSCSFSCTKRFKQTQTNCLTLVRLLYVFIRAIFSRSWSSRAVSAVLFFLRSLFRLPPHSLSLLYFRTRLAEALAGCCNNTLKRSSNIKSLSCTLPVLFLQCHYLSR